MRIGIWNVMSLSRAGSLKTVASELAKYSLDLVAVKEIRQVEGGSQSADDYTFLYGNANHLFGTGFFVPKGII